jgi:hypothetical protein
VENYVKTEITGDSDGDDDLDEAEEDEEDDENELCELQIRY